MLYICNKRITLLRSSISALKGHSCKILYICNKRSTHGRSFISATREALIKDPLYLQQEDHLCMILYICNKGITLLNSSIFVTMGETHVRSSIYATRETLIEDPPYLQQEKHSYKIRYICNKKSTHGRSSISETWEALMKDPLYLQQEEHSF